MEAYFETGNIQIFHGHVLDVLRQMPDQSVNCVVTSPPYWGLRDYGIPPSVWGGDSNCRHEWVTEDVEREMRRGLGLKDSVANTRGGAIKCAEVGVQRFQRGECLICGAWMGCFGLEPTPEMYAEHAVEIFGEVRRVLRDDGVLFLNLGDSYASGGMSPNQSRQPSCVPACGSGGTISLDSQEPDSSYCDLCDECRAASSSHSEHTAGPLLISSPLLKKDHGSGHLAFSEDTVDDAPPFAQASTNRESFELPLGECSHCDNCGACLSVLRSSSRDGRLCARRAEYINGNGQNGSSSRSQGRHVSDSAYRYSTTTSLKPKDLCGIPWMLAFALRADGWYLRQDIIWHKPNPMPESVTDRCTKAHEYIFLMSKSQKYHYDQEATLEPTSPNTNARLSQKVEAQIGSERANGGQKTNGNMKAVGRSSWHGSEFHTGKTGDHQLGRSQKDRKLAEEGSGIKSNDSFSNAVCLLVEKRNKRSVWTVATESFSEAHFATFPTELIKPCILAGCPSGGTVLDPFAGSGTTMQVARSLHCKSIGIELNPEYIEIAKRRLRQDVLDFNQ